VAACVGIDWADAQPDGCRQTAGAAHPACCQLAPTPAALAAGGPTRRTRFPGHPVALWRARTTGPLVSAVRTYACVVLCPLNPLTLARYRQAFPPRRATAAPTDAALQLARLLTHRDQLQPLPPQSPTRRARAQRVAHRRRVGGDQVRLTHRLTRTLHNSCPQGLPGLQDTAPALFCAVLRRWPPLKAVPRARRATLAPCFRAPHGR
jgi:hypothetical protein